MKQAKPKTSRLQRAIDTWNLYAIEAVKFKQYKSKQYLYNGLLIEINEVYDCLNKTFRGDFAYNSPQFLEKIKGELGDVCWFFALIQYENPDIDYFKQFIEVNVNINDRQAVDFCLFESIGDAYDTITGAGNVSLLECFDKVFSLVLKFGANEILNGNLHKLNERKANKLILKDDIFSIARNSLEKIIKTFAEKHCYQWEWMTYPVLIEFNATYYVGIDDVLIDLENDVPKREFIRWYEEASDKNYTNYLKEKNLWKA